MEKAAKKYLGEVPHPYLNILEFKHAAATKIHMPKTLILAYYTISVYSQLVFLPQLLCLLFMLQL